jgi:hypothetical protein
VQAIVEGLEPLLARGVVEDGSAGLVVKDADIIGFYAAPVLQRVRNSDAMFSAVDRPATSP